MWNDIKDNLPMNNVSYIYIAGYFNKNNRPVFYKREGSYSLITNHYWDAEKFNTIKNCRIAYGLDVIVFKLNFDFNLQVYGNK